MRKFKIIYQERKQIIKIFTKYAYSILGPDQLDKEQEKIPQLRDFL